MSRINPFDSVSGDDLLIEKIRRLADVIDELEEFVPYLKPTLNKLKENRPPEIQVFPAVILAFQEIVSNRWKYAWSEVPPIGVYPPINVGEDWNFRSSYSGTTDQFKMNARNGLEADNSVAAGGNGIDGVGIELGELSGAGTATLMPIGYNGPNVVGPADCVKKQTVLMMELPYEVNGSRHWFTASNAIKVECEEDG